MKLDEWALSKMKLGKMGLGEIRSGAMGNQLYIRRLYEWEAVYRTSGHATHWVPVDPRIKQAYTRYDCNGLQLCAEWIEALQIGANFIPHHHVTRKQSTAQNARHHSDVWQSDKMAVVGMCHNKIHRWSLFESRECSADITGLRRIAPYISYRAGKSTSSSEPSPGQVRDPTRPGPARPAEFITNTRSFHGANRLDLANWHVCDSGAWHWLV